jgi:hypothetical protein
MAADRIEVTRKGPHASVIVDGVEIPARAIRRHSLTHAVDPDDVPSVQLTLSARYLTITNTISDTTPSED